VGTGWGLGGAPGGQGLTLSRLYQLQRAHCRCPFCPQRPPGEVRNEVSGGPGNPLRRVQGLILGTFDFYSRGLQWVSSLKALKALKGCPENISIG
jgi:hypothetical protein